MISAVVLVIICTTDRKIGVCRERDRYCSYLCRRYSCNCPLLRDSDFRGVRYGLDSRNSDFAAMGGLEVVVSSEERKE